MYKKVFFKKLKIKINNFKEFSKKIIIDSYYHLNHNNYFQ